ncbi:MAG: hypothetical protein JNJ96_03500 [Anaerolineales bacterium]|nr:hypothetical protein [Anaerolineales bacterium]HNQ95765.1 hypothetical protein [Anaerolineales bacterium]
MELPNKSKAHVPLEKITEYLLSETHAVGNPKARYFRSYGFDNENAGDLVQGLIAIAQNSPVENSQKSVFGVKYVLDGELETPNGVMIWVRTIWIIENNTEIPRFVTAYPAE